MRRTQIASILIALVVITGVVPLFAQTSAEVFDVLGYAATIRPDIAAKTVAGDVDIRLRILAADVRTIEFDRGELVVDDVRASSERLAFDLLPKRVRVQLVKPEAPGTELALSIAYHGAPRNGLQFVPERQQAYTIFSTSQWLICVDAPADKATLDLRVVLPAGLHAVGSGTLVSETPGPNGTVVHRWREERSISSYLFGFAAGRFVESRPERAGMALRYIAEGVSVEQLNRIFGDTPDMLEFFATRAGVDYPRDSYEQVLVASTAGQEAWGFALFSDAYGRAVLDDPSGVWLIAHELAHQWWGNLVTCQDWNHFWLNEGFAAFMADAYDEHRFGREAYLKDVERARARYEAVREAGHDRSLVFPDWNHPTTDDRTLVYQKGAYVLHLLREQMGDEAFWNGIRHYTTRHAGGSVTTDDFKQSMEQSSAMKLDAFFDRWIYARS